MVVTAEASGIALPDREFAYAPISSEVGQRYLGAMRAAINCALANREILGHYARRAFAHFFPNCQLRLLFDVSHNTCKVERHAVDGKRRELFVHRKGATRAFGPGHESLPASLRPVGQPVLISSTRRRISQRNCRPCCAVLIMNSSKNPDANCTCCMSRCKGDEN